MNKLLLFLVVIGLAAAAWFRRDDISGWLTQKRTEIGVGPADTPAPTTPPATPNPANEAIAQARLTYPGLAKAGSPFNRKFIALYNELKASDPDFLAQPKWPLLLADRTAKELGGGTMPVVAATQHALRPAVWTENYATAVETAKAENKRLLLDFTGSDWCQYCQALDREVLNTSKFKTWAADNVVLVRVDFPERLPQSGLVKAQNAQLKSKYPPHGYPTVLIVDTAGNVLCQKSGYNPGGGPDSYIASLESSMRK